MRRDQRDHSVATEPKPVHPVGQPISASTNSGFKVRGVLRDHPSAVGRLIDGSLDELSAGFRNLFGLIEVQVMARIEQEGFPARRI